MVQINSDSKKFLKIAQMVEQNIQKGMWLEGEKLPSIRKMSKDLQVSPGTIQHAYALLEDRMLIEASDRSGFYVASKENVEIEEPVEKPFSYEPGEINILETTIKVMEQNDNQLQFQLGSAIPLMDSQTHDRFLKCLHSSISKDSNQYEGPMGYFPLRSEIARRSIASGKILDTDKIIITTGCQESLYLAIQAVTDPGDLVLVESPGYYGMLQTLELLKRKVLGIHLCPVNGLDMVSLKDLLENYPVKAMVINPSFQNPTGYCYSDGEKEYICRLFQDYDIPLIEDDIFADLSFDGCRPRSIHSFDKKGNVLLCSSFSKTLSQDLRIGWLEPGKYLDKVRHWKYVSSLGTPLLQQYALARFLKTRQYERHLRWVSREYSRKQQLFLYHLKKYFPRDIKVSRPRGGYLAWMKLNPSIDSLALYGKALKKGIGITPGTLFSSRGFNHYIRLNWGALKPEDFEASLSTLGMLIKEFS